ncbi:hypothetical protein SSCG_04907 [Streptomyces clavuligerus]|nr:hypothetical protein SSCG_04907 [Streptomyces clavuligerus]
MARGAPEGRAEACGGDGDCGLVSGPAAPGTRFPVGRRTGGRSTGPVSSPSGDLAE